MEEAEFFRILPPFGRVLTPFTSGTTLNNHYNAYEIKHLQYLHPPQFEVIEVEMESAVLQSSGRTSSTDSLENETFNW